MPHDSPHAKDETGGLREGKQKKSQPGHSNGNRVGEASPLDSKGVLGGIAAPLARGAAAEAAPSKGRKKNPSIANDTAIPPLYPKVLQSFQIDLLSWYAANARDLPWRRTRDPYAITVSEMMLQQTQVATVLPYYARWLKQFPIWRALAEASEEEVIKAWEGLGYYRRARNLHRLAQSVAALPGGELPRTIDELIALPGIGPYSARAIGGFAFGIRGAVVDGNVMRVLSRVFAIADDIAKPATVKRMQLLADQLQPASHAAAFNQAMMELGATVCSPRQPRCLFCPLQAVCVADDKEAFPIKTRVAVIERDEEVAILHDGARYWCEEVQPPARLAGLWRFPLFDAAAMQLRDVTDGQVCRFTYGITKYRVKLVARRADWRDAATTPALQGRWLTPAQMRALPFASAHRKIMDELGF